MSNITLFSSGAALPDYLRSAEDNITKSLAGSSGGKSISIKGGVWRMVVNGSEVARNEDRAMNVVIVAAAPAVARTYFEGTYEEGKESTPSCWSPDGKLPSPDVPSPQCSNCAACPQNIAGSGEGNSRACRFSQRIAVVLEGDISGNVYRLQLPAKSLFGKPVNDKMPLQAYAKFLAGHSIPIGGVVTEARFDTSEAVPVLKFRAVRPLSREEFNMAQEQGQSMDAMDAINTKIVAKPKAETAALPPAFKEKSPAPKAAKPAPAEDDEADVPAPTKRVATKPAATPVGKPSVASVLDEWSTDDDE